MTLIRLCCEEILYHKIIISTLEPVELRLSAACDTKQISDQFRRTVLVTQ